MSVWTELKERFLKFETIHGLYKIPLGILMIFVALNNLPYPAALLEINFSIHTILLFLGIKALLEGLYNLMHNPIKKQAKVDSEAKKYMAPTAPPEKKLENVGTV